MSKIINRGKIQFHKYRLYDYEANNIYDKVTNIIYRDGVFRFKYNRIIDDVKYKVHGMVKIRFNNYGLPHIYFIHLKFVSDVETRYVSMMMNGINVYIDMNNYSFITGNEILTDYNMFIQTLTDKKSLIKSFKRIDKDYYLINLILSLFNGSYGHGGMMVPYMEFTNKYEDLTSGYNKTVKAKH